MLKLDTYTLIIQRKDAKKTQKKRFLNFLRSERLQAASVSVERVEFCLLQQQWSFRENSQIHSKNAIA